MKAYTINSWGLQEGIPTENNNIWVGEAGRGRRLAKVPLPRGARVEDGRLVSIQARFEGALVLIKDQSGTRGSWSLTNSEGKEIQADEIGIVVAEGRCAEGAAGKISSGPEYLIAAPAGTVFYIRRTGRLYGAPASLRIRIEADKVEMKAVRDILSQERAEEAWETLSEE